MSGAIKPAGRIRGLLARCRPASPDARSRWLLALVLLLAGAFRFYGIDWDQGQHLHPDERFLFMAGSAIDWPQGLGDYFDEAQNPLNPRNSGFSFYAYGLLPLTLLKATAAVTGAGEYGSIRFAGRGLSALFDLLTVWLVYQLGCALYRDRRIALLAAFFYATMVAAIQHAHFFVVDPITNCFITAALLFLAKHQRSRSLRHCLTAGVFFGAAAACKISAATLVVVALAVLVVTSLRGETGSRALRLESALFRFVAFCVAGAVVFRLAEPDAFRSASLLSFLPSERWLGNLRESLRLASGQADIPPGAQWVGRTPLLFPWINITLWGSGLLLGLAGWIGWGSASVSLIRNKTWAHLLPVVWTAAVFLQYGTGWVMTMRYFLPIYGCLALLAAWLLISWVDLSGRGGYPGWRAALSWRPVAAGAAALVTATALLWAFAFTRIYSRPHTRVEASEWIYANIPKGSTIANEHWDDPLPLPLGRMPFPNTYSGVQMLWYHADNPEKLEQAIEWLEKTDYIVLSSNRLSESIPRLPARYPMTARYYRALLDGSLGFEQIAEFESEPQLLGVTFSSRGAEEAFSVYDHPRVRIFRKTPAYHREFARAILDRGSWSDVVAVSNRDHHDAPSGLWLPAERWKRQVQGGAWNEIFPAGGREGVAAVAAWLAALFAVGWAIWPYLYVACTGLPDRGYSLARILGLMVTAWLCWLWASVGIANFSRGSITAAFLVMASGGALLAWRRGNRMRSFLASRWKLLLAEEAVFIVAFAAMAFIRMLNPDLWHSHMGGEKPMDFAYLNAIIRTETFPPYNPWFAGAYINYYYFGFVPFAALIKHTATLPEVGYNLALVTLYALSAMAVFGLTFALVRRRIGKSGFARTGLAALAVLFVLGIGNLRQAQLLGAEAIRGDFRNQPLRLAQMVLMGDALPGAAPRWYFHASRAIRSNEDEAQPITEFPYFTFLYGDLHAHLMGLPVLLAALGLSISLAWRRGGRRFSYILLFTLAAWTLGASWAVNTWDVPICAALFAGGVLFAELRRGRRPAAIAAATTAKILAIIAAGLVLFLPFHQWWSPAHRSFQLWLGPRTPIGDYLTIFGLFLFALIPVIWSAYRRGCTRNAPIAESLARMSGRWSILTAIVVTLAASTLILAGAALTALLLLTLILCLVAARTQETDRYLYGLTALALVLTLIPEVLVLEGDISRMNTVFKFYFQAWTLFSICAAVAVSRIFSTGPRPLFFAGLTALVLGALLYPLTATPARAGDRFSPDIAPTLNGMSYLENADYLINGRSFDLNSDLPAIRWLRHNVEGTPVIAEMNTYPTLYGWGNRFSVYTGLPSIVGWDWHLRQQMSVLPVTRIGNRIRDVREIFDTPDAAYAWDLLCRYQARYVIVGELERAFADRQGLEKFDAKEGVFWDLVFSESGVKIYRVHPRRRRLISDGRPSDQ